VDPEEGMEIVERYSAHTMFENYLLNNQIRRLGGKCNVPMVRLTPLKTLHTGEASCARGPISNFAMSTDF
jgi:hypothetical protein